MSANSTPPDKAAQARTIDLPAEWWLHNLDEVDHEIARLATICGVKILEPGVIERVLHRDDSVCANSNTLAFSKLHDMLLLHYAIRQKAVDVVGHVEAAEIERYVVEAIKKSFPALGAGAASD